MGSVVGVMNTTVLGILTILAALINAAITFIKTGTADWGVTVAAVTAGVGLIKAKDAPSSGTFQCAPLMFILALVVSLAATSCSSAVPWSVRTPYGDAQSDEAGVITLTPRPVVIPAK